MGSRNSYLFQKIQTMNFLKFKFGILPILLCLTFYGVKSLTEEELAPILQQFKEQLFQGWDALKNSLESNCQAKIDAFDTSVREKITNHDERIDTLEKTDVKQNDEIEKLDDMRQYIDECANSP